MLHFCLVLSVFLVKTIDGRPQITLGYKPSRPFYHPNPGSILGQIIPPGKPWPDSPQGYQTSTFPNRFKEDPTSTISSGFLWETSYQTEKSNDVITSTSRQEQTTLTLGSKPNPPFFHPNPGNNIGQIIPPEKPLPDDSNLDQSTLDEQIQETATEQIGTTVSNNQNDEKITTLEYRPNRPSFHPNPGSHIAQIIPLGKPWPDSLEGYQNFGNTNLEDQEKQNSNNGNPEVTTGTSADGISGFPNRPSFHPNPGNNVGQVIPPGQPWPDSPEGYENFSQLLPPTIDNRLPEQTDSNKPESTSAGNQENRDENVSTSSTTRRVVTSGTISLEYKPSRPPFHPNPGNHLTQIIPPGQSWPSKPEDYQNFSQTTPNLEDRFQQNVPETKPTSGKPQTTSQSGFIWEEDTISDKFNLGKVETTTVTEGPLYTSAVVKETKSQNTEKPVKNRNQDEKPVIGNTIKKTPEKPEVLISNEGGNTVPFVIIPYYNLPPPYLYYF